MIETVKSLLDEFFKQSIGDAKQLFMSSREVGTFSRSLFEIEKHLYDLKKEHGINQRINPGIISDNIIKSFKGHQRAFNAGDYTTSLLIFLAIQKEHSAERFLTVMDSYFDCVKDKLTYADLVVTSSGATRCYTNLRFALNDLRNRGLIYKEIYNPRYVRQRSLLPTSFGYFVALRISNLTEYEVCESLKPMRTSPDTILNSEFKYFEFPQGDKSSFSEEKQAQLNNAVSKVNFVRRTLSDLMKQPIDIEELNIAVEKAYQTDYPGHHISLTIRDWVNRYREEDFV